MTLAPAAGSGPVFVRRDQCRADRERLRGGNPMHTRGFGATVQRFRTNDPEHLRELLSKTPAGEAKIVAMDGVNSMTGNAPGRKAFAAVARQHGALLYVDDAHGIGARALSLPQIATPLLGGAVIATGTFLISAACLLIMRRTLSHVPAATALTTSAEPRHDAPSVGVEIREGFAFVRRHVWLWGKAVGLRPTRVGAGLLVAEFTFGFRLAPGMRAPERHGRSTSHSLSADTAPAGVYLEGPDALPSSYLPSTGPGSAADNSIASVRTVSGPAVAGPGGSEVEEEVAA
jgi:hypothetical protein